MGTRVCLKSLPHVPSFFAECDTSLGRCRSGDFRGGGGSVCGDFVFCRRGGGVFAFLGGACIRIIAHIIHRPESKRKRESMRKEWAEAFPP